MTFVAKVKLPNLVVPSWWPDLRWCRRFLRDGYIVGSRVQDNDEGDREDRKDRDTLHASTPVGKGKKVNPYLLTCALKKHTTTANVCRGFSKLL